MVYFLMLCDFARICFGVLGRTTSSCVDVSMFVSVVEWRPLFLGVREFMANTVS